LLERVRRINGVSEIRPEEPMSNHTSFRVGGPAKLFAVAETEEAVVELYKTARELGLKFKIIGNGTNLLFKDEGFDGIVVKLGRGFDWAEFDGEIVRCGAAVSLSRLAAEAAERGLSGLEFAYGIPGTVGGALINNAGAHSKQIGDLVVTVEGITFEGEKVRRPREEIDFGYRESSLKELLCVTGAELKLERSSRERVKRLMEELFAQRRMKQPLGFPSAGSVFKNPPGLAAGALIERCGLKGATEGGAMVSNLHANFIVNLGTATASDIIKLIERVRDEVAAKTGIRLQLEIEIVG